MTRTRVLMKFLQVALGLLVMAFGVHLTIFANIGLAPWDCLSMGIAARTPLNYGLTVTVISVVILVIDLALGERIGYGTIIDAILTGNYIQFFNDFTPMKPCDSLVPGVLMMLVGFVFMALGMIIYMKAGQCCGPRDALMVALGKRFPHVPFGVVQVTLWAFLTLVGWLLGGPVGVGTILSAFGVGTVVQVACNLLHFEPRDVEHLSVIEANRILASRG